MSSVIMAIHQEIQEYDLGKNEDQHPITAGLKGCDDEPCDFWVYSHIITKPKSVSGNYQALNNGCFNTNMITIGAPCAGSVKITIARTLWGYDMLRPL